MPEMYEDDYDLDDYVQPVMEGDLELTNEATDQLRENDQWNTMTSQIRINEMGRWDVRHGQAPVWRDAAPPVTTVEVAREPAPPVWEPMRNDMVRVIRSNVNLLEGEICMIDFVDGGSCGSQNCDACHRINLLALRPSQFDEENEFNGQFYYGRRSNIEPVSPAQDGDWVRCLNPAHPARTTAPGHGSNADCIQPVMINSSVRSWSDHAEPQARILFADQLASRELRRQQAAERVAAMVTGQRYMIESISSTYYGLIAEIRDPEPQIDGVRCNILYPEGDIARRSMVINPFHLGARFHETLMGARVPRFIRFTAQNYSGSRGAITDHEITDSIDLHECDQECFEYGCSTRVRDDYDNEPEDHAGDVPIHSYSYRPNLVFSGDGPVYLGTELELSTGSGHQGERNRRAAAKIITESEIGHLVYLKSDGSISGYGFEACLMPMSYDWLVDNWPSDLLRAMRNVGAVPHDSCGMHVHVSRSGFSDPVHAYKWIKFMYRNRDHVSRMARRDPDQWGSFDRPDERAAAKWHAKGGYGAPSRYTAINCMPTQTYEVRIFASTLNRTRFLGSLGLIDASVEYTRQITTEGILKRNEWAFDPFRDYVHSFKKYAPLQKEMQRLLTR